MENPRERERGAGRARMAAGAAAFRAMISRSVSAYPAGGDIELWTRAGRRVYAAVIPVAQVHQTPEADV